MKTRLLLGLLSAFTLLVAQSAQAQLTLIKADRMLDVRSGKILSPASLVVENGLITEINPESPPAAAE